ncbi:MAG: hypothetical protein LBE75_02945 [Burkholderiales bacterium]|nr:hypothetical protein [Burkholderiales bacterium]
MYSLLCQENPEATQQNRLQWSRTLIVFLFSFGTLPFAQAQADSPVRDSSKAPSAVLATPVRLLALDANREVAVFEDTQGQLLTIPRGQVLPNSNERLTRVFADSVELTQQSERQPLIYFLKTGESLPDKRAETLEAVASKNRPVQQITVSSIPISETESPAANRSIDRPFRP